MSLTGTIDWLGENYATYRYVIKKFEDIMHKYSFDMIEPSILERYDLFLRTVGESSDIMQKELFFAVSKAKQDLDIVLRPEYTTSVIRTLKESGSVINQRVAYHGKTFRHDRPQKGRYREFTQLGCEVFEDNPYVDVDVIFAAVSFLNALGLNVKVKINSLGSQGVLSKYREILKQHFVANNIVGHSDNPIRVLDKMSSEDKIKHNIPKIAYYMSEEDQEKFNTICAGLKNLDVNFEIDDYLVRGLDYYNHTVFEIENEDLSTQSAILGGGRYSGLVKSLGGPDVSGIGWSIGLERLLLLGINQQNLDNNLINYAVISINEHDYAMKVASKLRENHSAIVLFDNMKKSMKRLGQLKVDKIVFCGAEEKEQNAVKVKDCATQESKLVKLEEL